MDNAFGDFDRRLSKIDKRRARLQKGYVTVVNRDGLIVTKPRRTVSRRALPLKGIVLLILGFMAFKALLLAHLGAGVYQDRLVLLQNGSVVEQAGAWVMSPDPITQNLAEQMRPFLK